MAVKRDDNYAVPADDWMADRQAAPQERLTSISARIVRSISVSMSATEMDALVDSFGKTIAEMTPGERNVQAEFTQAIESIR